MISPSPLDRAESPLPRARSTEKTKFAATIRSIITDLESEPGVVREIALLQRKNQIQRRRFYDVANIFTAIGCAKPNGREGIIWLGVDQIIPQLLQQQAVDLRNGQIALESIFQPDNSVGLAQLTVALLLFFPATGTTVLNLKDISTFFSRDRQRYKTTLCKLHQIVLILGALAVIERTEHACEVRLREPFDRIMDLREWENPLVIETLLNRPSAVEARKAELRRVVEKNRQLICDVRK